MDSCPFRLYDGGREAFPALLSAIEKAKETIEIHMFVWREDTVGREVAEALLSAAERGVKVRIVKDSYGAVLERAEESRLSFLHRRVGPSVLLKAALLSRLYAREAGRPRRQKESELYLRFFSHENITVEADRCLADHSKYYIFDGSLLFLGSMNIEDKEREHDLLGRIYGGYMVSFSGKAYVDALLAARLGRPQDGARGCRFLVNCKESRLFQMEEHYLSLIASAKTELLIVMPYLSPLPRFLGAITDAARRGVRVRILIPRRANYQSNSNLLAMKTLLREGEGRIAVYLSEKMMHAKLVLTEERVSLGSCNITKKAFRQLDETNVEIPITDSHFCRTLLASLEGELSEARCLYDGKELSYRPIIARLEGLLV